MDFELIDLTQPLTEEAVQNALGLLGDPNYEERYMRQALVQMTYSQLGSSAKAKTAIKEADILAKYVLTGEVK